MKVAVECVYVFAPFFVFTIIMSATGILSELHVMVCSMLFHTSAYSPLYIFLRY